MKKKISQCRSCILCNHLARMGCRSLGWCLLQWGQSGDLVLQSLPYCAGVLSLKVISQTLFMLQSWAFQKCFRHLHNFIQGPVCHRPVRSSETASSFCLRIRPSQHGTQKTNNLNFVVTFEIPSGTGRFSQSSPGRCNGTCGRHMSIWCRNSEQGSVPEASQAVLGACVWEAQQGSPGHSYKISSD